MARRTQTDRSPDRSLGCVVVAAQLLPPVSGRRERQGLFCGQEPDPVRVDTGFDPSGLLERLHIDHRDVVRLVVGHVRTPACGLEDDAARPAADGNALDLSMPLGVDH